MSDPDFSCLSERFLSRLTAAIAAVRGALEQNDYAELRRGLHNLSGASGMFGYQDISSLALRAEALCGLRPVPMVIVRELLDAIDDARCAHILTSTANRLDQRGAISHQSPAATGATSHPPAAARVQ